MHQKSKPYHKGSNGPAAPVRDRLQSHNFALAHPDSGVLQGTNMYGVLNP
jgi:hypothetical protein